MSSTCPQCGEDADQLCEGYCAECHEENYYRIMLHHAAQERWDRMTDAQKDREIRDACV